MKRLLILFLALVMLLGILAGCRVTPSSQNETVPPTTQTTAPAEDSTPSQANLDRIITPSNIQVDPAQDKIVDFGGSFIPPVWKDLSKLTDENLYDLAYHYKFIVQWYYPCNKEDAMQCGSNFAHILFEARDREVYEKVLLKAEETFDLLKDFYDMDSIYSWVLVGLFNPDILVDFFSGEFDEEPNPIVIDQIQKWIPDILCLHHTPELVDAIDQNPLFKLEYLPTEEG